MADIFHADYERVVDSPAYHGFAVTPHNSNNFSTDSRALYVGGAGDISALMAGGESVTFVGVTAGSLLPVRVRRVNATGTTATNIVGLY